MPRIDPIERLPILILFPHSRCNCRCVMCDIWKSDAKDELSAERVQAWITEWRSLGVERIVLSGGEPLLHSQFDRLTTVLGDAGFGITLISTGLLLKRDARVVAQRCDDVVVSLDGPRDVHNRIRNLPTAYDKLAQGVRALRDAAPNGETPTITARCTVQRQNADHLRATVRAAREIGVDFLSFLAVDTSSEAFNREGGWPEGRAAGVGLDRPGLDRLEEELNALEREHAPDFHSGFLVESPSKLRDRLWRYFSAGLNGGENYPPVQCNAPWVSSVIEADGTVRPCFFQPSLGNIYDGDNLRSLLNSDEAVAWRRKLDTSKDSVCRRCVCSLNLRRSDPST